MSQILPTIQLVKVKGGIIMLSRQHKNLVDYFHTEEALQSRKDQIRVFFCYFLEFKKLIEKYEKSFSQSALSDCQSLKEDIQQFIKNNLISLDYDIHDSFIILSEYIKNFITHKKLT